jgi:hypothetical protein
MTSSFLGAGFVHAFPAASLFLFPTEVMAALDRLACSARMLQARIRLRKVCDVPTPYKNSRMGPTFQRDDRERSTPDPISG